MHLLPCFPPCEARSVRRRGPIGVVWRENVCPHEHRLFFTAGFEQGSSPIKHRFCSIRITAPNHPVQKIRQTSQAAEQGNENGGLTSDAGRIALPHSAQAKWSCICRGIIGFQSAMGEWTCKHVRTNHGSVVSALLQERRQSFLASGTTKKSAKLEYAVRPRQPPRLDRGSRGSS